MPVLISPTEWEMLDAGEGVILAGAKPGACHFWLSRSLVWLVAPESVNLPDDFGFVIAYPESEDRWVSFRIVTAEWLTWLRQNYLLGKDPRTVEILQARQRRLKGIMEEYIPHMVGATAELPESYEPPPMDGVTNARQ